MIPAGAAAKSRATFARAPSSEERASSPSECWAPALPTPPSRNGRMTATTRGSTGENPAKSMYTRGDAGGAPARLVSLSEEEAEDRAILLNPQQLVAGPDGPALH